MAATRRKPKLNSVTDDAEAASPKKAPKTVIVGCKIPNGLHMDLTVNGEKKRVTLNGSNSNQIIGGHGITHGVDKDFFDQWMKEFKDLPAVVKGLIFAHESPDHVSGIAKERQDQKTGLEGINPTDKNDQRNAGTKPADAE